MTTKAEPLTGLELAVAVAESVMGWDTSLDCVGGLIVRTPSEYWRGWEPWHDMRAAWEVVEKLQAFRDEPNEGYARWVNFANLLRGEMLYTLTGAGAGLAILRAALATMKGEADALLQ